MSCNPEANSITPVLHEYQKRVIKSGFQKKSPFVDYESKKDFTVSRNINEIYNLVCQHGWETGHDESKETIIDYGTFFIPLGDLADSVAPGQEMYNTVCEIGIHVINAENKDPNKFIMPLRISKYLIECRFDLKDVKRCFASTGPNRLDHKQLVCFPTLQGFTSTQKITRSKKGKCSGHYWLVVLNIRAGRFEIIDSLGNEREPLMMDACHLLIASIKKMWSTEYKKSKIKITDYPIEVMPSPRQTNTVDCGFFTLKNLEGWFGRKPATFDQSDMPNIRKLFTEKWLRFHENKAPWKLII